MYNFAVKQRNVRRWLLPLPARVFLQFTSHKRTDQRSTQTNKKFHIEIATGVIDVILAQQRKREKNANCEYFAAHSLMGHFAVCIVYGF